MAGSSAGDRDFMTDINVTPLVDVMLVLLVVLMVTTSFAVSQSLAVTLPQATGGAEGKRSLTLVISAEGQWSLDGEEVTQEQLRARMLTLVGGGVEPQLMIAADGAARHREVVAVMDLARGAGVRHLSVGVQPE